MAMEISILPGKLCQINYISINIVRCTQLLVKKKGKFMLIYGKDKPAFPQMLLGNLTNRKSFLIPLMICACLKRIYHIQV